MSSPPKPQVLWVHWRKDLQQVKFLRWKPLSRRQAENSETDTTGNDERTRSEATDSDDQDGSYHDACSVKNDENDDDENDADDLVKNPF